MNGRAHLHTGTGVATLAVLLVFHVPTSRVQAQHPEPLTHRGVICVTEEPLGSHFAQRLAADGKPVFLIGDIGKGVSQGDIVRFRDKAVLIDADVWQTMQSTGILKRLKDIPIITLTARADSKVWDSRADQVSHSNENKGYTLGRELLKVLEDYFGNTPSRMELVVRFNKGYMSLIAPRQLMAELNFVNVRRVGRTSEKPFFITDAPPERAFVSEPFSWTVWAVDPVESSGDVVYSMISKPPPGLSWNKGAHTLEGTPTEAGSRVLSFRANNSSGGSARLACTLTVYANTPPRVQAAYDEPLLAGGSWQYTPFVADAEHTLKELAMRLFRQPEGMRLDPEDGTIHWEVPEELTDTTVWFGIGARDPLGAVGKTRMPLRVVSPRMAHQAVDLDFRLPLDTMIQGHSYRWPDSAWMEARWHEHAIRLKSISGDTQTEYRPGSETGEGVLTVRPMEQGAHGLVFTFMYDTMEVTVRKSCTVLPNRPPVFRSRLGACEYSLNQPVAYTPVAVDPDNDSLSLRLIEEDGNAKPVQDATVLLTTDRPGVHTILVTATDPFGNQAHQQIHYTVKKRWKRRIGVYAQKSYRKSVDIGVEAGAVRIGVYSPDITKTLTTGVLGLNTYESPFVFFGVNPLGQRQTAMGNYCYFDAGASFRAYSRRLFGGGVLGRVQANYRHRGVSPWRFQGLFTFRLKQALFIVDTVGLGNELASIVDEPEDVYNPEVRGYAEQLAAAFGDYGKADNIGLYLRLQTLLRFPVGFWAGPAIWIEDDMKSHSADTTGAPDPFGQPSGEKDTGMNFLVQFTGLCLFHEWRFRWLAYSQQLHIGFRGDRLKPKFQWNLSVRATRKR